MAASASTCRAARPSRVLASLLALAIASGGAVALPLATPAYACACGAMATLADSPVTINSEAAIVSLIDGQERIDMRLGLDALSAETGLIVPTPTPATVSLGAMSDFTVLNTEMTPRQVTKDEWWRPDPRSNGSDWLGAPNTGSSAAPPTVISQVQLGPIEATTLAAGDAEGLTGWLGANGYGLSEAVTERLGHYVDREWAFVAMKLTGDKPLGELTPIRFEFASDEFVYPMFLSQAATTTQVVHLYILADHRQTVAFADGKSADATVNWARLVRDIDIQQRGMYLTAVTMRFTDPESTITDDLVITRASTDEEVGTEVIVYNYMALFGIPIGWLLVFFVVVIMSAVILLALSPRRLR